MRIADYLWFWTDLLSVSCCIFCWRMYDLLSASTDHWNYGCCHDVITVCGTLWLVEMTAAEGMVIRRGVWKDSSFGCWWRQSCCCGCQLKGENYVFVDCTWLIEWRILIEATVDITQRCVVCCVRRCLKFSRWIWSSGCCCGYGVSSESIGCCGDCCERRWSHRSRRRWSAQLEIRQRQRSDIVTNDSTTVPNATCRHVKDNQARFGATNIAWEKTIFGIGFFALLLLFLVQ